MNNCTKKSPARGEGESFARTKASRSCVLLILFILSTNLVVAQTKKLTLSLSKAPLSELIAQIESQTGYVVNMVKEEVELSTPVTVNVSQASIQEVLTLALKGT